MAQGVGVNKPIFSIIFPLLRINVTFLTPEYHIYILIGENTAHVNQDH